MHSFESEIIRQLEASATIKHKMAETQAGLIEDVCFRIIETFKNERKLLVFGNGGSAADSQHFAAELVGRFRRERRGLAAIALTTDASIITSLANDYSFDIIFSRQIESLGKKGDLCVGLSTSGKSKSVIMGLKKGKEMGLQTIACVGEYSNLIQPYADLVLSVPANETARIQEGHSVALHIICDLVENYITNQSES